MGDTIYVMIDAEHSPDSAHQFLPAIAVELVMQAMNAWSELRGAFLGIHVRLT